MVSKPREIDGLVKVKVHYQGWGGQYDEWRPLSEVTGSANETDLDKEEQEKLVELELGRIKIEIQESLTGLRRCDTRIKISEPVNEKHGKEFLGHAG